MTSTQQMNTWLQILTLIFMGFLISACASLTPPRTNPHEVVSAKLAKAENVLKPLPEMTVRDYEALGDRHYQQGDLSLAFLQYDKALRIAPDHLGIRYKKSRLFLLNGSVDEAIRSFQDILTANPNYVLAHEGLGESFLRAQQLDQAETSCRRAVELEATRWRAYNCLGMTYDRKKQFKNAVEAYQQAIKLQPQQGMLLNNLGLSYLKQGQYENSANAFKKALVLEKHQVKVYNNLGLALSKLGRYEEALETFAKGGNKAQAYNNLGVVLMAEGQYREAIESFEKAISLNPAYYETAGNNLTLARRSLAVPGIETPMEPTTSSVQPKSSSR